MRQVTLKGAEFAKLSAEILAQGGSFSFEARGWSMFPFIQDGDILTVQPTKADDLNVGDVAFYRAAEERLVAHRVVGREARDGQVVLAMRGDATPSPDEWVQAEQVLGRVVSVQWGKKVIRLDQGFWRLAALLWINLHPLRHLLFRLARMGRRIASWLLRRLQGSKFYRALARKLICKQVRYRLATVEDASDLSRLHGYERFPELGEPVGAFARQIDSLEDCGYTLIASVGEGIAGAVVVRRFPENADLYPEWWLFNLLVRMRYRGAGIGEGLLRMAMGKAAEEGGATMNLLVFEQNRTAINLYRKMGFRQISIPKLDSQLEKEVRRGQRRRIIMSRLLEAV